MKVIKIIRILKDIRNRICHNNVLFNVKIEDKAKLSIINNILNKKINKANLTHILDIIEIILNEKDSKLLFLIKEKFIAIKEIDIKIKEKIEDIVIKTHNL